MPTLSPPDRSTPTTAVAPPAVQRGSLPKRAFDLLTAASLLLLAAPLAVWYTAGWLLGRVRLESAMQIGRHRRLITRYRLVRCDGRPLLAGDLPLLWSVLRGERSIVGPRAVGSDDPLAYDPQAISRFDVQPGLVGLFTLWRRMNMAYGGEAAADRHYVEHHSLRGDLGILARVALTSLYGTTAEEAGDETRLLGIRIDNLTMTEAIARIVAALDNPHPAQVCFVNADCCNVAYRDEAYRQVLEQADLTLADGIGMKLAGKLLRRPIRENVNGTDLFPRLCEALAASPHGLFLLGARPGVAKAVADWIREHHPTVNVCGWHHGYFSPEEEPAVLEQIRQSGARLLLVAFGVPGQEKWIAGHLPQATVRVAIGVGGLFDFYSGRIPRAPLWMRELGLEWLFRFWQEPRRMWRRYFVGNALFLWRVWRSRR